MKLRHIALLSIAALAVFAACTEKNDAETSGSSTNTDTQNTCMPVTVSFTGRKYLEFGYNTQGKMTSIKTYDIDSQVLLGTSTISYTDTSVTFISPQPDREDKTTIYKLNAKGLAELKLRKGNFTDGSVYDTTRYEYDANGYLIKETYHNYFTIYTINKENLTKIERYDSIGAAPHVTLFEVSSELRKYPYFFEDISDDYFAQNTLGLCGKLSKNLMSKLTRVSGSGNSIGQFTYGFDAKGNVTKVIITEDSETGVIGYGYICK